MATVKEVYELLKKKQAAGEKIGMFAESLIEAFENEQETSTTKEVHVSFIKNTEDSLLRVQVEEEERYNLFKRDEDNSTLPLFFKPIRGVVIDSIDHQKAHYGIDIVAKENEVVKATLDGTVIMSSWTSETGNVIAIQHSNDFISVYKHNSVLLKKEGVSVRAGEAIAIIGNSGKWSSGPHLHFELWQKGTCIDPQLYINF